MCTLPGAREAARVEILGRYQASQEAWYGSGTQLAAKGTCVHTHT